MAFPSVNRSASISSSGHSPSSYQTPPRTLTPVIISRSGRDNPQHLSLNSPSPLGIICDSPGWSSPTDVTIPPINHEILPYGAREKSVSPGSYLGEPELSPIKAERAFLNHLTADDGPLFGESGVPFGHQLVRLSSTLGLQGQDVHIVLSELRRLRNSKTRAYRRRYAMLVGLATAVVCGAQVWMLVQVASSLLGISLDPNQENPILNTRILGAQLAICVYGILISMGTLLWARMARRTTAYSNLVLFLGAICSVANISMAIINFVMVLVFKRQASTRCHWGYDFTWTNSDAECGTEATSLSSEFQPWVLASSVRLLGTIIVALAWVLILGKFKQVLSSNVAIDPKAVRDILNQHQTDTVALESPTIMGSRTPDIAVDILLDVNEPIPGHQNGKPRKNSIGSRLINLINGRALDQDAQAGQDSNGMEQSIVDPFGGSIKQADLLTHWQMKHGSGGDYPDYEEVSLRHDTPERRSTVHDSKADYSPAQSMRATYDYAEPEVQVRSPVKATEESRLHTFVKSLHWRRKSKTRHPDASCFRMEPIITVTQESEGQNEAYLRGPISASTESSSLPSPHFAPNPELSLRPHPTFGHAEQAVFVRMNDGKLVRKLSTIYSAGSQEFDYDNSTHGNHDSVRVSVVGSEFTVRSGLSIY